MMIKRPPLLASVLALSGICVLCGLGNWQLERLAEKEAFLEQLSLQQKSPPGTLTHADFSDKNLYKRGTLKGRWLPETTIKLMPRSFEGTPGAHVYTALETEPSRAVMINRGWIAEGSEVPLLESGPISGEISKFPTPNFFTPENPAEGFEWYRISPEAVEKMSGGRWEIEPFILRADDGSTGPLLTAATKPQINNNHASYAAFWFCMAFVLAGVFFLRFMREPKAG